MLASVCARWDDGERHYEAALRWAVDAGAGLSAAWARVWWAEMLLARSAPGDRPRAALLAAEALPFAERWGLGRVGARARAVESARD